MAMEKADLELKTLVIERIYDAPVDLVWQAWSDPNMVTKWWGPKDWACTFVKMDFQVGGRTTLAMKGPMPDGSEFEVWSTGVYQEITPKSKIVITDNFADPQGNPVPSSYYGMDGFADEGLVTVTFEEIAGKTKMVLNHVGMPNYMVEGACQGWSEQFDKLAVMINGGTCALTNKAHAIDFLDMIVAGDVKGAYAKYVSPSFRHHNPNYEGSAEALMNASDKHSKAHPEKSHELKIGIAEGDFVSLHHHIHLKKGDAGYAVTHIFRFQNCQIVELWDVGQEVPAESINQYGMF